jgi:ergothioneine biosynthesis protein EgtB
MYSLSMPVVGHRSATIVARQQHAARSWTVQATETRHIDSPQMRRAGRELLSLALIDARNHSLRWFAAFEDQPAAARPALWELGHVGWFQEHWIARNVQRRRGASGDATHPKLASILPGADAWFDSVHAPAASTLGALPGPQVVRQYLVDTLETTLDLLGSSDEDDDALYFYRLALLQEDERVERFATLAQTLGIETRLLAPLPARGVRAPLRVTTTRWRLGSEAGGLVLDNERWAHEVLVPEFEIDAQAVSWAQYAEFVEDGGYDDRQHWSEAGWAWVQAQGRRTPRYVDQLRHGVLQQRFGELVRVPLTHPVVHVCWHEADAWCRWAGRRLPNEAEWELAASRHTSGGFRWGEVREWMAGSLRPLGADASQPALPPSPGQADDAPLGARVLRGASAATRGRLRSPKARRGRSADADEGFFGFRSCAV